MNLSVVLIASESKSAPSALVTPAQAARELDVSESTVRRWLYEGRVPGIRVGGRLRLSRKALEQVVKPARTDGRCSVPGDAARAVRGRDLALTSGPSAEEGR